MSAYESVIEDLQAESLQIDSLVADIEPDRWDTATPAPGWTVAHQVAHLTFVFGIAGLAVEDPDTFTAMTSTVGERGGLDAVVNADAEQRIAAGPAGLLEQWQEVRDKTVAAFRVARPDRPVPWLVNPLPPAVLASAGMMELFAHGQDIADALPRPLLRGRALRHLVTFGVRTWDFGYEARGIEPPAEEFHFSVTGPDGELWEFGDPDATQRIRAGAEDFCLLVTRRRHPEDLAVTATGGSAQQWLHIAQAYRGPAGVDRRPGQFREAGS